VDSDAGAFPSIFSSPVLGKLQLCGVLCLGKKSLFIADHRVGLHFEKLDAVDNHDFRIDVADFHAGLSSSCSKKFSCLAGVKLLLASVKRRKTEDGP